MNVTRYLALDARTGELLTTRAYMTVEDLERDPFLAGKNAIARAILVDLAPVPFTATALGADETLVVTTGSSFHQDDVEPLLEALEAALDGRWLVLTGEGVKSGRRGPSAAPGAPERLPWSAYSGELTTRLQHLADRFPYRTVADAAAALADMIDEHGRDAVLARRERRRVEK